jgi:hypothetical protein
MNRGSIQKDLAGDIGEVFNLAGECAVDPERVAREHLEAEAAAAAAREYQRKMQRTFEQCPGFIGADAPTSERSKGCVIIEPALAREARDWLKRRFYVNENLELSDQGLCIEIIPRVRKRRGGRSVPVSFVRPEQFTLAL